MIKTSLKILYFCVLFFASIKTSYAGDGDKVDNNLKVGNWNALIEHGICYAKSIPVREVEQESKDRRDASMLVYYLGPDMYTIGVDPGYLIDEKKNFTLTVQDRTFYLNISRDDTYAKTYSSAQDVHIIDAFIKTTDNHFTVRSYNQKGEYSIDYYSLVGLKEALRYLQYACIKPQ